MASLSLFPTPPLFTSLSTPTPPPSSRQTLSSKPSHLLATVPPISSSPRSITLTTRLLHRRRRRGTRDFTVGADDVDVDSGGGDDYDMDADEEEVEELDNKKDYDVEYDRLLGVPITPSDDSSLDDIEMVQSSSFVSTQGTVSDKVVDYRINEDEFHKINLLYCDFFIRKPPDPDNNVYDFREMYVTPPDTDVYSIPKVLAPMPQKYIRCSKTDFGCYNVTEPPIDAPRDPLYKTEREIFKITLPEGKDRDRRKDLLIIRDGGTSFKIIEKSKRDDATTVIEREEWIESRRAMEKHLSKLRDFHISNWF